MIKQRREQVNHHLYRPQKSPKPDKKSRNQIYSTTIPKFDSKQKYIVIEDPEKQKYISADKLFRNKYYQKMTSPTAYNTQKKFVETTPNQKNQHFIYIKGSNQSSKEKSVSPRKQWNSSVRTKDADIVKQLKTKVIDMTNENRKLRWQLKQAKRVQRENLKRRLFPKSYEREEETQRIRQQQSTTQRQGHDDAEMVNEKLVRRVEELEKINDETSLKIKEIRDAETGSKNEFIKYSNKLQEYYAQKIKQLETCIRTLKERLDEDQYKIRSILKNKQVQNTIQFSKVMSSQFSNLKGDTQQPYQPSEQFIVESKHKYKSSNSKQSQQKYEKLSTEHESLLNQMMKMKNEMSELKNQNQLLKSSPKTKQEPTLALKQRLQEKQIKLELVLKNIEGIKQLLGTCHQQNFETLNQEVLHLIKQKNHLQNQIEQFKKINEGKKVWQLQKELNECKKKNKQVISKCVELQKYIQKNMQGCSPEIFWTEGIFENYYIHGCTCQIQGNIGEQALKWNKYVKQCINQTIEDLDRILNNCM